MKPPSGPTLDPAGAASAVAMQRPERRVRFGPDPSGRVRAGMVAVQVEAIRAPSIRQRRAAPAQAIDAQRAPDKHAAGMRHQPAAPQVAPPDAAPARHGCIPRPPAVARDPHRAPTVALTGIPLGGRSRPAMIGISTEATRGAGRSRPAAARHAPAARGHSTCSTTWAPAGGSLYRQRKRSAAWPATVSTGRCNCVKYRPQSNGTPLIRIVYGNLPITA